MRSTTKKTKRKELVLQSVCRAWRLLAWCSTWYSADAGAACAGGGGGGAAAAAASVAVVATAAAAAASPLTSCVEFFALLFRALEVQFCETEEFPPRFLRFHKKIIS